MLLNSFCCGDHHYSHTSSSFRLSWTNLLSYFLEAVEHGYTWDAVDLAERVEADWIEMMLAGNPGILDDGAGRVVNYYHGLVVLEAKRSG